jgi:hypothetical protein
MRNTVHHLAMPCALSAALALSTFTACGDDDDAPSSNGGSPSQGGESARAGDSGNANGLGGGGAAAGAPGGMASIARGDYLVNHVAACGDCHTPRDAMGTPIAGKLLAGNAAFADLNPADDTVGLLPAPNLTPDKATGLGNWTDEQVKAAFLNGVDDEDEPLLSVMPYYVFHNMTDDDADSIVMYLRSIPAVKNEIPERQDLGFPVIQAQPVPSSDLPDTTLEPSDPNYERAQNGRYLAANVGVCLECHTEHDPQGEVPLMLDKLFQGNEVFTREQLHLPPIFPEAIYSSNITPGENGIKDWTPEDVVKVLKEGIDDEGQALCPPMPFGPMGAFGGLSDSDARDIGIYLTTLEPADTDPIAMCVAPGTAGGAGAGGADSDGAGGMATSGGGAGGAAP